MTDTDELPDTLAKQPPREPEFLADIETHIIEITEHDQDGVIYNRRYMVLFNDTTDAEKLLASNFSVPVTTESDL